MGGIRRHSPYEYLAVVARGRDSRTAWRKRDIEHRTRVSAENETFLKGHIPDSYIVVPATRRKPSSVAAERHAPGRLRVTRPASHDSVSVHVVHGNVALRA